jgi:hypothetical protein
LLQRILAILKGLLFDLTIGFIADDRRGLTRLGGQVGLVVATAPERDDEQTRKGKQASALESSSSQHGALGLGKDGLGESCKSH